MALPPVGEPGMADPHVAQLITAAFAVLMLAQKARAAAAEASFKKGAHYNSPQDNTK
jgi:hypothetical protein